MDKVTLSQIFGSRQRFDQLIEMYSEHFGSTPSRFFSAPGRTEISGNHTDHNHGRVMAAAINLDVIAAVEPTDDGIIAVKSEGFTEDRLDISDLEPLDDEKNSSLSLIRGVCAGFKAKGLYIGGFKAYTRSRVLKGSGLSSSAAFEVLIGTILSGLYNGGSVSPVEIAKIAQFSENVYFGKPSGLMDQMASSVGGLTAIDFYDPENPIIEAMNLDLAAFDYSLAIVDTRGSHADLTPEYAAIPAEMKSVARYFGKTCLREIDRKDVLENISDLREKLGDRAILRALHFFDENDRVAELTEVAKRGDFTRFLELINLSGESSYMYLQNVFAVSQPEEQGVSLALYMARRILGSEGAARVHGGGFAGTIQAFVPNYKLTEFVTEIEKTFGEGSCYVLSVRSPGGSEVML